jgi:aspartate/glutamate racemase
MKTIGVLGGIGPQATMDFEQRLHQAPQRLIPRRGNSGYPPLNRAIMQVMEGSNNAQSTEYARRVVAGVLSWLV